MSLIWKTKDIIISLRKLSKNTTTTEIIGRLPITNRFENISNFFFLIKGLTL